MSETQLLQKLRKDCSELQENSIAKLVGGTTQKNSGGTRFGGGDVHTKLFLVEAKTCTTSHTGFNVRKEWLVKAATQAFEQGKRYSSLAFRFEPHGEDFFIVSSSLFKKLLEHVEESESDES